MGGLFGGGKKSNSSASDDARKSREANRIAQERQLAAENEADRKAGGAVRRRAPKGRRLFEDKETLGTVS